MTLYEKSIEEIHCMAMMAKGHIEVTTSKHLHELGLEKSQYNPLWRDGTLKIATWGQKLNNL